MLTTLKYSRVGSHVMLVANLNAMPQLLMAHVKSVLQL